MKLIARIAVRLSLVLVPLMALWAALFYFTMVEEINDEVDDNLEDYSELIIVRMLAGRELPSLDSGSNNSYSITPVDSAYLLVHPRIRYDDVEVYIPEKEENEPARVLTTLFQDAEGRFYELRVATPSFERDDLFAAVFNWVITLYCCLLVIVIAVTVLIFHRSMRPLYALLRWFDGYVPGRVCVPVPNDTRIAEFRRLNIAAQKAVDRSEHLFEEQKTFIGNASHELQTPLAVLGNRIEWMIDNTDPSEEQLGELLRMNRTLAHIVKLNKTLLLLTKIDNGQFPECTRIDVAALAGEQVELCSEIYSARRIGCTTSTGSLMVDMNHTLAVTLVSNLVRNAFIHTPVGGCVEVRTEGRTLAVVNDGTAPLDASRIFRRFYQGTKHEGSTGLGLALVKAICDSCSLSISYGFECGRHRFVVTWP